MSEVASSGDEMSEVDEEEGASSGDEVSEEVEAEEPPPVVPEPAAEPVPEAAAEPEAAGPCCICGGGHAAMRCPFVLEGYAQPGVRARAAN